MIDFNKISWRQITNLCGALRASSSLDLATVRRWYDGESVNFGETFNFISELGVASLSQNKILLGKESKKCLSADEAAVRRSFVELLFRKKTNFKKYFGDFFARFELQDSSYVFMPDLRERLKYSGVRNFLIGLGVLEFDAKRRRYTATSEISPYLLDQTKVLTYNDFVRGIRSAEALGLEAELAVLRRERKILKGFPALQKRIRHLSLENVGAGYDILSFEKQSGGKWREKYIEVKAVSESDWRFYWSRNEMAKAKEAGKNYYLYLVPVSEDGDPNLSRFEQIADPYENVFQNKERWAQEVESISFYDKRPLPKK